jgi:prepilin-type N-terminal cleavage/methylation domain-containing protein
MLIADYTRRVSGGQDGFTLVEMLVALVTGLVVMFALFGMLKATTNQTRFVTDRVQTDRLGRQAMTRIVDELHSACIAREATPIQSKSKETVLVFYNAYSEGAEVKSTSESKVASESVYEHEIIYEPGEKNTGKLKEKIYPSTEVVLPNKVVFSATPAKTVTIAEDVKQIETKSKEKLPVFEYLQYGSEATSEANASITTLEKIPLKEGETLGANAASAAGVGINFEQTPTNRETRNENSLGQGLPLQTQITLALGAPNAETPIVDAPCD